MANITYPPGDDDIRKSPRFDPVCCIDGKPRYSKWQLASRLFGTRDSDELDYRIWYDSRGVRHDGLIQEIQREDGSGKSFNITIQMQGGGYETFHVRTLD